MRPYLRFLEPLDVLFLRGNRLFGDPGSYGEALVPPWPSVAAGALRSRMLAEAGIDLPRFARGETRHDLLGARDAPGAFTVVAFHLARRAHGGEIEILMPPPADLVVLAGADGARAAIRAMRPTPLAAGLDCSMTLPLLPVLAEGERRKPTSGYWLRESGWRAYLAGAVPKVSDLVSTSALWGIDHRVGVGLEAETRRAAEGRLFSVQAIAMKGGVGFLCAVTGAEPPCDGSARFGGDGRAVALHTVDRTLPVPDYEAIANARRFRLVLTSPGIFERGWLPTGAGDLSRDKGALFDLHGVRGRIVCAAVPRAETVSGWDLARWEPKPALRAAPTGSVYWIELDAGVSAEALRKLVEYGLWTEAQYNTDMRRAEGFNRVSLAEWK